MTDEERLAILGQDVIDMIATEVAEQPPPSPMDVEILRRIFSGSGQKSPVSNAA